MNAITQDLLIKLEMGKKKAIRLGKVMPPLKSEVKKTKGGIHLVITQKIGDF